MPSPLARRASQQHAQKEQRIATLSHTLSEILATSNPIPRSAVFAALRARGLRQEAEQTGSTQDHPKPSPALIEAQRRTGVKSYKLSASASRLLATNDNIAAATEFWTTKTRREIGIMVNALEAMQ
jgi:hypothetical protein